jgi:hypothetical protein
MEPELVRRSKSYFFMSMQLCNILELNVGHRTTVTCSYYLLLGLDRYRYRVSGDTHQYRLVSVSGDTFLSIAADTSLVSVGHGAIIRRDKYRADTVFGRASHARGSRHTRHISTCSIL